MKVQFVASVSLIVKDPASSKDFYQHGLNLEFEGGEGDYVFTERLPGVKHFGLWPLSEAAKPVLALTSGRTTSPCRLPASSSRWRTCPLRPWSSRPRGTS